ncbi:MAG: YfhO family protein [Roseburia sp.]|nr:YfhO family protein [Roseburia sp.]
MSRKKYYLKYTGLFLVIFFFGFVVFFIQGKSLVWKSDGYRQYYPVLQYLGDYYRQIVSRLFHGDFRLPMLDYRIGQGEDMITTFANYGFGDPLTLFSMFVPGRYTEYLYDVLVVLRLYLSGAAFLIYCDGMKLQRRFSIYGALVYVFCGFAIWSVKDPFFLNGMIYLPLVLLGIEYVWRRKSPLLLAVSVFFSIVSSYYFFYMIVIAAVCYFAARSRMKGMDLISMCREGLRCIVVSAAGVLLSGIFFVPWIFGYMESGRTQVQTSLSSLLFYDLAYYKNMLARFLMTAENDDAAAVGYFSMAVIVLPALLVLFSGSKPLRGRNGKGMSLRRALQSCVLISLLAAASPFIGYMFNGFGYVTNRFMFIPAFLLSLVLVVVFPELLQFWQKSGKARKRRVLFCAGYAAISLFFSSREGVLPFVFMAVLLAGTVAVLSFVKDKRWRGRIVCGLIALNLIGNCNLLYQEAGAGMADAYMEAGTVYGAYMDSPVNEARKRCGNGLDRVDVMLHNGENPNQSVVADYHGISVYYSVIGSGYSDYMMSMENAPDLMFSHRMLGNDGRTILENLANVRFVASEKEELVPYGFEKVEGKKNLYENTLQTSIGYTYDRYMEEEQFDAAGVAARQNALTQAAVLEKESVLSGRVRESGEVTGMEMEEIEDACTSLPFELTDCKNFDWSADSLTVKKKKGSFRIAFEMEPGKEYYLRLGGFELIKSDQSSLWAKVKMGKISKQFVISDSGYDFYFGRSDYVVNLGSLSSSQSGTQQKEVTVRLRGPAVYKLDDIELLEVPVEEALGAIRQRNAESLQDVSVITNGLTGKIRVSGDRLLCIAVPYKKGYTLYVDGKKTETGRVNKMYIGAFLEEGEHEIRLEYRTPGIFAGGALTIIGIFYIIFLVILHKKHCRK